ncbi:MazG-like family protein [Aneurinibacillus sp. REN35]|uniref:MazG-like family protein n=1 Tax=Aneurinibacillus sp. REN35 TaxID=3237286 RepID=UPI0035298513
MEIVLPRLNRLVPSLESTFHKLVEEQGELSEAILSWMEEQGTPRAREALENVAGELLDVAQTCISMTFVLEDLAPDIRLEELIDDHLSKLLRKGYLQDVGGDIYINVNEAGFREMSLPRLVIPGVTLDSTVLNISVAVGRFAQWIGKFRGASGEVRIHSDEQIVKGCGLNLLHIAQCCVTMLYILEETFLMDTGALMRAHVDKLKRRGYVG